MSAIPPPVPPVPPSPRPDGAAPPPTPVVPLGLEYHTANYSSQPGPNKWQQMAKASWVAPIVAMALGCMTGSIREQSSMVGIVIGGLNGLLILAGFVLAIIALSSTRRSGREGVLAPAIMGLILNSLLIIAIAGFTLSLTRNAQSRRAAIARSTVPSAPAVDPAVLGKQAFENYDGWLGRILNGNTTLVMVGLPDDAPFVTEFRGTFTRGFSVAQLTVRNGGTHNLVVDPDSLVIQYPGEREVHALPTAELLKSVKGNPAPWIARWATPYTVAPGVTKADGFVFLPPGTSLKEARVVTILVDGLRVPFDGRFLTVKEKADLIKASQQTPDAQK